MGFLSFIGKAEQHSGPRSAGGALIMPFLDAETPRVWRTEWARLAQVSFEVRPAKDNLFALVMTGAGAVEEIAVYRDRALAVAALSRLTDVLSDGGGGMRIGTGWLLPLLKKIFKVALWIVVVVFALSFLRVLIFGPVTTGHTQKPASIVKTGVPQSAEEMFGN
jgi:hypothetical protein